MGRGALACNKERAIEEDRTLRIVHESGFYLLPAVVHTYAPVGETPLLRFKLNHDHLSVIGAVSLKGKLYFQVHEHAISTVEEIVSLEHLHRQIPGKVLIIWDGAAIHRSGAIKQFLREGGAT